MGLELRRDDIVYNLLKCNRKSKRRNRCSESSRIKNICTFAVCAMALMCTGCGSKKDGSVDVTKYEHVIRDEVSTENNDNNSDDITIPVITEAPDINTGDAGEENKTPVAETFTRDGMTFRTADDTIRITASKVRVRTGPSTDYEIVYTASLDEQFKRTADGDGNWDQIEYNGQLVYIYSPYIAVVNGDSMSQNNGTGVSSKKSKSIADLTIVDVSKQKYTYDEMSADLKELENKYPDYLKVNSSALTKDGRIIYEAVLGNPAASKHIIIHASVHGREYMTTLVVMKQLEYYLAYMETENYNGTSYKDLFDAVAVHIVPMVNPDGVSISQSGLEGITRTSIKQNIKTWYEREYSKGTTTYELADYLKYFKANANGVDINRNFDYGWDDFTGNKTQSSEKYKGVSPASEPESALLVKLTEEFAPVATISYHAAGEVLYWDYGQTDEFRERCNELVTLVNGLTGYAIRTKADDPQDAAGYGDWCAMVMNIPSVTIEIGKGNAPLEISEFSSIWNQNWQVPAAIAWQYK